MIVWRGRDCEKHQTLLTIYELASTRDSVWHQETCGSEAGSSDMVTLFERTHAHVHRQHMLSLKKLHWYFHITTFTLQDPHRTKDTDLCQHESIHFLSLTLTHLTPVFETWMVRPWQMKTQTQYFPDDVADYDVDRCWWLGRWRLLFTSAKSNHLVGSGSL